MLGIYYSIYTIHTYKLMLWSVGTYSLKSCDGFLTWITIAESLSRRHRQAYAVKNELIYIWVYYIKIYDPIKFSSNLRVCCPGAINTCSHYERQVTSDRKNERNVSSYIIYIHSLLLTLYIFIFSLSHPFCPSS